MFFKLSPKCCEEYIYSSKLVEFETETNQSQHGNENIYETGTSQSQEAVRPRQDSVKNESDSDTFESTSQSEHHWEWDESDPEVPYSRDWPESNDLQDRDKSSNSQRTRTIQSQNTKETESRQKQNTHKGWNKSELVSQNQMITAICQFWTKCWL